MTTKNKQLSTIMILNFRIFRHRNAIYWSFTSCECCGKGVLGITNIFIMFKPNLMSANHHMQILLKNGMANEHILIDKSFFEELQYNFFTHGILPELVGRQIAFKNTCCK